MTNAADVTVKFAEALDQKFERNEITTTGGRKYDRVVSGYPNDPMSRSVHCFVERATGHVLKAAGWAAPAKGVRFDLSTAEGFVNAVEAADPYGSYLYAR